MIVEPEEIRAESEVSIRRAPRYPRFLIVGAGLGAALAFILTALYPSDPAIGFGALFGYFVLFGIPIGLVLGAVAALLLDRRASRLAGTAIAGKLMVRAPVGEQSELEADNT